MGVLHYLLLILFPQKSWSLEVALHLRKSAIWSYMKHRCHAWVCAPSYYLRMLAKLQKQICSTFGPSFAASLKPLVHQWNLTSLVFSIGITLVDVHLSWLNWFYFLILKGIILVVLIYCMIFFVIIPKIKGCLCQQFLSSHS